MTFDELWRVNLDQERAGSYPAVGVLCDLAFFCHVQWALISAKLFHCFGRSSMGKNADTEQTGMQAPQSMHPSGLM